MIPEALEAATARDMDTRMVAGLKKVLKGELDAQAYRDGLAKVFRPRMDSLWKFWETDTLFRHQHFRFEQFLTCDEKNFHHDSWNWYEFSRTAELTYDDLTARYSVVEKYVRQWILPNLQYRRMFLDDEDHILQRPTNKEVAAELIRLKNLFGAM